jgi:hypothetical protein
LTSTFLPEDVKSIPAGDKIYVKHQVRWERDKYKIIIMELPNIYTEPEGVLVPISQTGKSHNAYSIK